MSKLTIENGMQIWRNRKGQFHRKDGPAVILEKCLEEWWLNNLRHREDGPAVTWVDNSVEWWLNDLRHREDGPAITDSNGSEAWYLNGMLHRLDGPAIIYTNSDRPWWMIARTHDTGGAADFYYFRGQGVTDKVETWMKENDFPEYSKWTESHKLMFRLAFSGTSS